MSTASTSGKMLANTAYYSAVDNGRVMGYARFSKMIFRDAIPKLDFTSGYKVSMVVLDVGLALATKDIPIKQGIIPADILK